MKLEFSEELLASVANTMLDYAVAQSLDAFLKECADRNVKGKLVITFDIEEDKKS
jgi:hypothetical protein